MKEKEDIVEKEWECAGLKCVVIFVRQSHRCGYVAVPTGHPAWDKNSNDLPINVHGGITFAQRGGKKDRHFKDKNLYWFGFDCAHAGDKLLGIERAFKHAKLPYLTKRKGHLWTLREVVAETKIMAKQLKELTLKDIVEEKLKWMPDWFKDNVVIKGEVKKNAS